MFNNLSTYQETSVQGTREAQILEFNNQYETYDRNNVRGSDLYSLLNRAIDYNRRKSTAGTGSNDEGQYISYEPITIKLKIKDIKQLSADGENNRLIKNSEYTISNTENTFEKQIKGTIDELENDYGSDSITNLATNITKIFPTNPSVSQQEEAVARFKSIYKKDEIEKYNLKTENITWRDLNNTIKNDVYTYYEYVQFKRAYFNCTKTTYNDKTGRVIRNGI